MDLKPTNHSYYCSDTNFYVGINENFGRSDYQTWQEFKELWLNEDFSIDHDYNHCFRFDIKPTFTENSHDPSTQEYSLHLYFLLQRKGIFKPVWIKSVYEKDMPEVERFLKGCWDYLQHQWSEIAN